MQYEPQPVEEHTFTIETVVRRERRVLGPQFVKWHRYVCACGYPTDWHRYEVDAVADAAQHAREGQRSLL